MSWQDEDVPWAERSPPDRIFKARRSWFLDHGMLARVSPWQSHDLLGLKIEPKVPFMREPPNRTTPWHVSIAFEPVDEGLRRAFERDWTPFRDVRLRFKSINWNGVAELDPRTDPIATSPVIRRMHEGSWYARRPLHITF